MDHYPEAKPYGIADDIHIGDGRGEFVIEWYEFGGEIYPTIRVPNDAWHLLLLISYLIPDLIELDKSGRSNPGEVSRLLAANGIKDISDKPLPVEES
jgi:hypothetical protein